MLIKILYVVLVLSTVALLATAGALYWRVRRHMASSRGPGDTGQFSGADLKSSAERKHG